MKFIQACLPKRSTGRDLTEARRLFFLWHLNNQSIRITRFASSTFLLMVCHWQNMGSGWNLVRMAARLSSPILPMPHPCSHSCLLWLPAELFPCFIHWWPQVHLQKNQYLQKPLLCHSNWRTIYPGAGYCNWCRCKGALKPWPPFGTVNQVLAYISLLVITVYLKWSPPDRTGIDFHRTEFQFLKFPTRHLPGQKDNYLRFSYIWAV